MYVGIFLQNAAFRMAGNKHRGGSLEEMKPVLGLFPGKLTSE